MLFSTLQKILKPIFGTFEQEELKKFLRMGLVFAFIIGTYWTLRTLKNATFCSLIGASYLPWAKTVSLICFVFFLMLYTRLLDLYKREKVFYILSAAYSILTMVFAILLSTKSIDERACALISSFDFTNLSTYVLAFASYIFIESYGSLVVALFWAIASDTTKPNSAKQGFYLVTAIGQLGGIFGPFFINRLPRLLGFTTNAFAIGVCSFFILISIYALKSLFAKTPKELLVSYHGVDESKKEAKQEPGFFEGLRLLISNKYLLGIYFVLTFVEILVTIFDLHFNSLASASYTGTALAEYLGVYGTSVNFVALACLLLGISNITKYLGLKVALALMPVIFGVAVLSFSFFGSLTFLFGLMVGSKAIHYALNNPAIKQLYIPTTHNVRFKAQAWIETFGSRGSKEMGALWNMLLGPLQSSLGEVAGRLRHVMLSTYLGMGVVFVWFFIALYLGKTYKKAVDKNEVVC